MKYSDLTLENLRGHVEAINVLSNEGDIYTAEAVIHGIGYTIEAKATGLPMVFHSFIEAKREFEHLGELPIRLETTEVFDEMVGERENLQ
ncbi:MAG: DUF6482 family protein [Motiliproteus sp.]|nr:DUF6482 family protein [Motiliproteus sp.]MCW9052895.1 DUF6482 family protein [Motiliproteus sp.]